MHLLLKRHQNPRTHKQTNFQLPLPAGTPECDIIMWMDHRASVETDLINATKHRVLKFTGGTISLEMEPPKLLWLKTVGYTEKFTSKEGLQ